MGEEAPPAYVKHPPGLITHGSDVVLLPNMYPCLMENAEVNLKWNTIAHYGATSLFCTYMHVHVAHRYICF